MASWTSRVLHGSKTVVYSLIVVTLIWFVYSVLAKTLKGLCTPTAATPPAPAAQASFKETDVVKFVPTIGVTTDVTSDRTADAILGGAFGPAVVMIYATWCSHCQSMEPAFEAAAKAANVPFVKIQGQHAPVTALKYAVTGYPTIFGVARVGGLPRRFSAMRTTEAFLEFSKAMDLGAEAKSVAVVQQAPAVQQAIVPAVPVAPPAATVAPTVAVPAVVEPMPPTVAVVG